MLVVSLVDRHSGRRQSEWPRLPSPTSMRTVTDMNEGGIIRSVIGWVVDQVELSEKRTMPSAVYVWEWRLVEETVGVWGKGT